MRITDREVKSHQLVKALVERAPIIIVTIQTFPFVLEAIQSAGRRSRDAHLCRHRRRGALLPDAALAAKLKRVLTAAAGRRKARKSAAKIVMLAAMEARKQPPNISFFAFTATPKAKTIELFGRPGPDGIPGALPRLQHAAGHRGGLHPRCAQELPALQAGLPAGPQRPGL